MNIDDELKICKYNNKEEISPITELLATLKRR